MTQRFSGADGSTGTATGTPGGAFDFPIIGEEGGTDLGTAANVDGTSANRAAVAPEGDALSTDAVGAAAGSDLASDQPAGGTSGTDRDDTTPGYGQGGQAGGNDQMPKDLGDGAGAAAAGGGA